MKARVERSALAKGLRTVLPAVKSGGNLPVLNGVHIEATRSALTLTCSDLDLTIAVDVAAADTAKGVTIVPASLLAKIVATMGAGAVELDDTEGTLRIACGETVADLHTINADDWPKLAEADGPSATLSEQDVERLARILPFASTDMKGDARYRAAHFMGNTIGITDSRRAALLTVDAEFPEALVPITSLMPIVRGGGPLTVTIGDRVASFATESTTHTARLAEGDYRDLTRFERPAGPHRLTFATAPLLAALGRVDALTDLSRPVTITRDGDKAILRIKQHDVGELTDIVPCDGDFEGTIGFHGPFLGQLIEAAPDDEVTLELVDPLKYTIVRSENLFQLLMPVRITPGANA